MPLITNRTALSAGSFALMDPHARQFEVIVVSATFCAPPGRAPQLADEQAVVRAMDVHYGEPGRSSARYECDIALEKPLVDVLVVGDALAPQGRKARSLIVSLEVADIKKVLRVHGDRFWRSWFVGGGPSAPRPFTRMPIVWERAFGGTHAKPRNARRALDPRNPVGVGFGGARSSDPDVRSEVPNVEYVSKPVRSKNRRSVPAGLGVVMRHWQPRAAWAGTYDKKWQEEQFPLLPLDFNPRFWQAAPPDQQSRSLRGGEIVEIRNMTPEGRWRFELPAFEVPILLRYDDRGESTTPRLDTVVIEPHQYRVTLTARCRVPVPRNRGPLIEIVVGEPTPGWWRGWRVRKQHRTWTGSKAAALPTPSGLRWRNGSSS